MHQRPPFLASLAILASASVAGAATVTIPTFDRGWYDDAGQHDPANDYYLAGVTQAFEPGRPDPIVADHRDWFAFDLAGLDLGNIEGITLRLDLGTKSQPASPGTFTLYDVSLPAAGLMDGTGGAAAFADLADGTVFGSYTPAAADTGFIDIPLNTAFLAQFEAARGSKLVFGGALTAGTLFGGTGTGNPGDGRSALVIVDDTPIVPEPATLAPVALLTSLGLLMRPRCRGELSAAV